MHLKLNSKLKTVILTGAGISADSGIPTFRDPQDGFWSEYNPEDLATTKAFDKNPRLVMEWYEWRRQKILASAPNIGHHTLASWQDKFSDLTLITQNVDGFHQQAGSRDVIEMHGSIHRMKCRQKNHKMGYWIETTRDTLPQCNQCDSLLRPDIVWFNEVLDSKLLMRIYESLDNCEVFIAIGTSGIVYPAAGLMEIAKNNGALTIVVNIAGEPAPYVDRLWTGRAAEILPLVEIKQ